MLDIQVSLDDGRQVDVEMQIQVRTGISDRFLYYWAKLYGGQLEPGGSAEDLEPLAKVMRRERKWPLGA